MKEKAPFSAVSQLTAAPSISAAAFSGHQKAGECGRCNGNTVTQSETANRRSSVPVGIAVLIACLLMCKTGWSQTATFEGLKDEEEVLNYYNGGLGGSGSGPGPNYGMVFGSDALAIIQDSQGGTGNFANQPSGITAIDFLSGPGDMMNVPHGFQTGFSFYYSAINDPGAVQVYSGLNDTGTLLATLNLPVTPEITPAPDGGQEAYDNWAPVGVTFSGTAESVNFTGTANQITFDNITINSNSPNVPEPASIGLLLAGIPLLMRRRPQ